MNSKYYEEDDTLVMTFSDHKVEREVSQGWNINVSYDANNNIAEIVILEAKEKGLYPVTSSKVVI